MEMKTISAQILHVLFTKQSYLYVYDLSKLTYGGFFLISILQKQFGYAIIGLISFLILFILGKYMEQICLKH